MKMIHILYDTNTYFIKQVWEEFFCRSITSAKRILKRELKASIEREEISKECMKEVLTQFDIWVLNKKTMWGKQDSLQICTVADDFYVWVREIELL